MPGASLTLVLSLGIRFQPGRIDPKEEHVGLRILTVSFRGLELLKKFLVRCTNKVWKVDRKDPRIAFQMISQCCHLVLDFIRIYQKSPAFHIRVIFWTFKEVLVLQWFKFNE